MDRQSVARPAVLNHPRPAFDLPAALGSLDRRIGALQYAIVGMQQASAGHSDDILILAELAQAVREGVVTLRIETDGLRLVPVAR